MPPIFPFRCDVCCLSVNSSEQLTQHFNGSRHKRNANKKAQGLGGPEITKPSDYFVSSGFIGGNVQVAQSQIDNRQCLPQGQNNGSLQGQNNGLPQGQNNEEKAVQNVNSQSYCATCRVQLTSPSQAEMHYRGGKHRQKLKLLEENALREEDGVSAKKAKFDFCEVCNVKLLSPAVAAPHYSGDKHRKKVRLLQSKNISAKICDGPIQVQPKQALAAIVSSPPVQNERANPATGQTKGQSFFCSFCGISVNSKSQMEAHMTGNKHKANVQKCLSPPTATSSLPSPTTYSQPVQVQNYSTYQYQPTNHGFSGQYVAQY